MIAICVVTYNQEKYIEKALESVLAQKVDCDFLIFIGEDCSTDNTRAICLAYKKKYPERIRLLLHEKNLGLVKNTIAVLKEIQDEGCKYVAMLDGDDYWTDKQKLQKQYKLLEDKCSVGLVHTNNEVFWTDSDIEREPKKEALKGNVFYSIENYNIANCTVMFRTSLLQYIDFDDFQCQNFMSCDYVMYAIFSKYTEFDFIEDFTSVWRRGHSSVSNTNCKDKDIAYVENDIRMWNYLGLIFPERFGHTEKESEAWRNYRIFNIAYRYRDFELANSMLKKKNMSDKKTFAFLLKQIMATNRVFFNITVNVMNKRIS